LRFKRETTTGVFGKKGGNNACVKVTKLLLFIKIVRQWEGEKILANMKIARKRKNRKPHPTTGGQRRYNREKKSAPFIGEKRKSTQNFQRALDEDNGILLFGQKEWPPKPKKGADFK